MHPILILNPDAGRIQAEAELRLRLSDHPLLADGNVHLPATGDDARLLARRGREKGFDPIIAGGGDGTVNAVVNGLMEAETGKCPTLGVVPLGTANDFARTLELPEDPVKALELIESAPGQPLDLIRVEDEAGNVRHAANAVTGGFTAEAEEELIDEAKETWGPLAYLRTGLGALPDPSNYRTTIQADGGDTREVNLLSLVVANGRFAGGGIAVAPEARVDDGLLDVILVPEMDLGPMAAAATAILQGEHLKSDEITTLRARRILLTSEPPIWLSLDGELLQVREAVFQVVDGALSVVRGGPPP